MKKFLAVSLILLLFNLAVPTNLLAAMSSTDFYIYADTIDAGGILSTGGEYSVQSSLGESPVGVISDGIYEIRGGYQAMENGSISLDISSSSLNLGTLSTSSVNSVDTNATVSSDASTGYVLSIGSAIWAGTGVPFSDVIGGTVTTGTEAYGIAVSGTESNFSDDQAVTSSLVLASSTVAIPNSITVLTFKAAISSTTLAGSRSQTVSLSASANF